jgi:hypothetical protein
LFSQKLLTDAKQALVVEKKGKKDMVLADVQACFQMEDRRNNWFKVKLNLMHYF